MDFGTDYDVLIQLAIVAVVVILVSELLTYWDAMKARAQTKEEQDKNDPYGISTLELTREESKAFGLRAPYKTKILMHVAFLPDKSLKELVEENPGWGRVDAVLYGTWSVHANGRLSRDTGEVTENLQVLSVDESFYKDAQLYLAMLPEKRVKSNCAPSINTEKYPYRLVWHRGGWYLDGAQDAYVLELQRLRHEVAEEQNKLMQE